MWCTHFLLKPLRAPKSWQLIIFFYSNWGKDWCRGLDFEDNGIDYRCNEDGVTQWKMPGLLPLVSLQMKGGEGKQA